MVAFGGLKDKSEVVLNLTKGRRPCHWKIRIFPLPVHMGESHKCAN